MHDLYTYGGLALIAIGGLWWWLRRGPREGERGGTYRVLDCHCGGNLKCKLCHGEGKYRRRVG